MTESILKSIASILVDAMYHIADMKKWEACKAQIIQHDSAVKDLNIRAALLTLYIAIERLTIKSQVKKRKNVAN